MQTWTTPHIASGMAVFSPLDFPAAAAACWVPTASVAGPCAAVRTKPASSSSCLSCTRRKNKPRARQGRGRHFPCWRAQKLVFETFWVLKLLCKCNVGLVRAPGTAHTCTGHRAPFVTITNPPLGLPTSSPLLGSPGHIQPCRTSWVCHHQSA